MATRFYFPLTLAAPVTPPTHGAEWEHPRSVFRSLLRTPDSSTLTTSAFTPDSADDLTNKDAIHAQYVSAGLAAQTISGNITAQMQCLQAHNNNNLFLTYVVKVISNDGTTVRATLLPITRASTEFTTALTNRTFPSTALTQYTCVAGDRILIEQGVGGTAGPASGGVQGHNGSIRVGCNASGGDLPVDETTTGTTFRGWFEFSNTLVFQESVSISATAIGVAALSKASVYARTIAVTNVGVAALSQALLFSVPISVVNVGVASLSKATTFARTITVANVGVAGLSKAATFFRTIAASAVVVASLNNAILISQSISVTAVGVATLSKASTFFKTIAAVVIGSPSLSQQFIAGDGGAVDVDDHWFSSIWSPIGWR